MTALGVYVGNDKAAAYSFEQWLGREVDFVHVFVSYEGWTNYLSSANWQLNSVWPDLGRGLFWSVPLITEEGNLADAAGGAYNNLYRQMAETILNGTDGTDGTDKIYIRTGWEANGDWFVWSAAGKEEDFKQAFREMVETFQEVSDRFVFEWNVTETTDGINPATIYPGDDYVDVIGMDFYYNPQYQGTDPAGAFAAMRDSRYGLQWLEDFASAHGKPTSYSEWGVQGDNAAEIVRLVKAWFDSHDVVLQSYWDSDADYPGKLSDNSEPATGAAFKEAFSGATTVAIPDTTPAIAQDAPAFEPSGNSTTVTAVSGAPNNKVWGTAAQESWTGTSGNDFYQTNGGGDTVRGVRGDDTYVVSAAGDTVVELPGEGVDTIQTWLSSYTLPDNVENLTFFGSSWSNGRGNDLANIIIGNDSPNMLDGRGGNDLLTGGSGNDTFVIRGDEGNDTITDFRSGEGDKLLLQGFGEGATLSHQGDVWTIHAADGSTQQLTLTGVTSLSDTDYTWT